MEDPQASKQRRLEDPFSPAPPNTITRRPTLSATTNSAPRPSVALEVNDNRTSTSSPTSTVVDADPVPHAPAKSKADGEVLECPMTCTMYNDPHMLRKVRKDLAGFLRLVDKRLREMESDDALDVWGAAMTQLEKVDGVEAD